MSEEDFIKALDCIKGEYLDTPDFRIRIEPTGNDIKLGSIASYEPAKNEVSIIVSRWNEWQKNDVGFSLWVINHEFLHWVICNVYPDIRIKQEMRDVRMHHVPFNAGLDEIEYEGKNYDYFKYSFDLSPFPSRI